VSYSPARSALLLAAMAAILALPMPVAGFTRTLDSPPLISASEYPSHSQITVMRTLSNQQMDCAWGFACSHGQPLAGDPRFHLTFQDALHRISGWGQLAQSRVLSHRMLFAIFVSRYDPGAPDGLPWNVRAFMDFRVALMDQNYQDLDPVPRLAPAGVVANQSLQEFRAPADDIRAMTCWTGAIEAEGVVVYQHGSEQARQIATHDLIRQLRAGIRLATAGAP
jgi:hypothetical protein